MIELMGDALGMSWKAMLAFVLVQVVWITIAVVLEARGLIARGTVKRLFAKIEQTDPLSKKMMKNMVKTEFSDNSLQADLVKAIVNEVDEKKTPEAKAKRAGRFLGKLAGVGLKIAVGRM
jgi:hypothetical protein